MTRLVSLVLIQIILLGYIIGIQNSPVYATGESVSEIKLVRLINLERARYGQPPLALNSQLIASSKAKGLDMLASNYWSHVSPLGVTPWDFIQKSGYSYEDAGENLAYGFTTSITVISTWLKSPSHRDNLISTKFTDIGIAVYQADFQNQKNTTLIVAHFGGKYQLLPDFSNRMVSLQNYFTSHSKPSVIFFTRLST